MERSIRLGKDFNVRWSVRKVVDGERQPYELAGKELVLQYRRPNGTLHEAKEWRFDGNIIIWTFRGRDQKAPGSYGLILTENGGKDGMVTVDTCKAFKLVEHSCEETEGSGGDIVIEDVVLESEVAFAALRGPQGEQGPAGPQGPQGERGPEGPQGPAGPSYNDTEIKDKLAELSEEIYGKEGNYLVGCYLNKDGSFTEDAESGVTDFIPYTKGNDVLWRFAGQYRPYYILFYRADKSFITGSDYVAQYDSSKMGRVIPMSGINAYAPDAAYIRASFDLAYKEAQIQVGSEVAWTPIGEQLGIEDKLDNLIVDIKGEDVTLSGEVRSGYVNTSGSISANDTLFYVGYDLTNIEGIVKVKTTEVNQYARLWTLFSSSEMNVNQVIAFGSLTSEMQEDTIDLSLYPSAKYLCVTQGVASDVASAVSIRIGLTERVEAVETMVGIKHFEAMRGSASLANGGVLTLSPVHIGKNAVMVARCKAFAPMAAGVGYLDSADSKRDYGALWVEVDGTSVKVCRYYNEESSELAEHGLTLDADTTIELHIMTDKSVLRLYDGKGNVFTQDITSVGVGQPFIINNGATQDFSLSFYPQELERSIWVVGDSYISYESDTRWGYYLKDYGYINFLSNNQPGLSPLRGVDDLTSLLATGAKPTYLLWLLGMNGTAEESGAISDYQKTQVDKVVALCEKNHITPVFATIPPVPNRQRAGYNAYIKSLGVRVIDCAAAVGATDAGVWKDGMLSTDNVHPTALGGKAIASQILLDFPEITNL